MRRNFDTDDREFLGEIEDSLANLRAKAGPCPHPDLVMAAAAGVHSDSSEGILRHIHACPMCQQLTLDLSAYEYPGVSEEEDRRLRARWADPDVAINHSWWTWLRRPYAIGGLAAVLLLAISLELTFRQRASGPNLPGDTAENQARPEPPAPVEPAKVRTSFVLSKAAIKIPATAVLTFRSGSEEARAFLSEFASALEPYRNDDFVLAARRLEPLARKYRESAEVPYYLGVSRLFLNQDSAALESLETARRLADETLRDDISWYLALTFDRAGRVDDTRREIQVLCSRAGDYQKQACAALDELR